MIYPLTLILLLSCCQAMVKDDLKESWVSYKDQYGQSMREKVYVSLKEKSIMTGEFQPISTYIDFKRSLLILHQTSNDGNTCFVTTFNKSLFPPSILTDLSGSKELNENQNVPSMQLQFMETSSEIDPSVLSNNGQDLCKDAKIYWLLPSPIRVSKFGRIEKRGIRKVEVTINLWIVKVKITWERKE